MATFITPATVAKWDDTKRTNFAEHVAAKVNTSLARNPLQYAAARECAHADARRACRKRIATASIQ